MDFKFFDTKPLSALGQVIESIGIEQDVQNKCMVCSMALYNDYMLDIGIGFIHESCCRCSICGIGLNQKCHEKNGRLYCEEHYYREFTPYKCNGCKEGISPKDMVYKLKCGMIYHISCHCCYRCGRPLAPGDQILVDSVTKTVSCVNIMCAEMVAPVSCENAFPSTSSIGYDQQQTTQFNAFEIKKEVDTYGYNFDSFPFSDFCDDDSKFLKRRGPRTTIKQNQLDVLNKIFSTTPKPSKHSRAKLALETGLSMRVIQVWFQNRRSKERRLKHLCNYLRHYEQRGLLPPHININTETGAPCDLSQFHQMMLEQQTFDDDEEIDE